MEFMPLAMNRSKSDRVGDRQMSLARQLRDAGLLSEAGYQRVAAASGQ